MWLLKLIAYFEFLHFFKLFEIKGGKNQKYLVHIKKIELSSLQGKKIINRNLEFVKGEV